MKVSDGAPRKRASRKRGAGAVKGENGKGSPEVVPEEILTRVQRKILAEMEGIIDELLARAKSGKYADAKFLFQFAGVGSIPLASEDEPRVDAKELAERFLREITGASEGQQPQVS